MVIDVNNIKTLNDLFFKALYYRDNGNRSAIYSNSESFNKNFAGAYKRHIGKNGEYDSSFKERTYEAIVNNLALSNLQIQILRKAFAARLRYVGLYYKRRDQNALILKRFDQLVDSVSLIGTAVKTADPSIDYCLIHAFVLAKTLPTSRDDAEVFLDPRKAAFAAKFVESANSLTKPVRDYLLVVTKPETKNAADRLAITVFLGCDESAINEAAVMLKASMGARNYTALAKNKDVAKEFVNASKNLTANERERLLATPRDKQRVLVEVLKDIANRSAPSA